MISNLFAVAAFALIPPAYFDSVVAIGRNLQVVEKGAPVLENGVPKLQWVPIASGFLYGNPTGEKNDKGDKGYHVFLVTNRHVVQGLPELILRFNPKESKPAKEYRVELLNAKGQQQWFAPPDPQTPPDPQKDVAVVGLYFDRLVADGIKVTYFAGDDASPSLTPMSFIFATSAEPVYSSWASRCNLLAGIAIS